MKHMMKMMGAASLLPFVAISASPAFAAGTDAGTTIENNVTVSFQVAGVDQTAETASDEFVVDRKVNLTVEEVGDSATIVSPNATSQVTTFTVTNLSNDTLDFGLAVAQQDGGAATHSGTDNFDTSNVKIYIDDDGTAGFSSGDSEITYIDELAADTSATIFVVSDIASDRETDDVATVILTATARAGGAESSQGAVLTTSATNTVDAVDTVLADLSGTTDSDYDGTFSASDDYIVSAAALSATKTSRIVSDPITDVTGGTPKAIPGAVVEYCIAVSNAAGSATATDITVTDTVPDNVTFVAGSILVDGTVDTGVCQADGTAGGSFDGTDVSGTLSDLDAGDTLTLVFRATID